MLQSIENNNFLKIKSKHGNYLVFISFLLWGISNIITTSYAQQAAPVIVDPVISEPLAQTIPVLGRLVAQQKSDISALIEGPVDEVHVQIGDEVEKGSKLVTLRGDILRQDRALKAALLEQAKASLLSAEADYNLAAQELARLQKLSSSSAFSPAKTEDKEVDLNKAKVLIDVARASVGAARANLSLAEINLKRSIVRAPFSGVVSQKYIESGAYVSRGQAVVALINHQDLEVEADVPSNRLMGLEEGALINVEIGLGQKYQSIVRAVIPEENVLTRTRAVRFTLGMSEEDAQTLASGQTVSVQIPVGATRDVKTVHKDGLVARGAGYIAYIVEDGKAAIRNVAVRNAVGGRFEIFAGLNEGDLVVIRGNERLRPGQAVQITNPETVN